MKNGSQQIMFTVKDVIENEIHTAIAVNVVEKHLTFWSIDAGRYF